MNPFFHSKISFQVPITEGDHQQQTSPCPPFLFDSQHHHKAHEGALHEEIKESSWCNYNIPQEPVKWMSSKMRIMRKMINSYQTTTPKPRRCNNHQLQDQKKANLESIIRVCSDCNTTKTPLWRSGPCGPKSLCNACGIRQRKARRAMAASAMKDKVLSEVDRTVPFKKRCRFSAASVDTARERKLCFEDIVIRLSKSSAFHRVFPQDEKDAAILLMALSSGLLCSSS